jgi:DNA-binding SARP family transcriptional activator
MLVGGEPIQVGGPKPRALLAALIVNRRRAVSSQALADIVWNEEPPDSYQASLQVFVSNIRKVLRNAGIDSAAVLRTESAGVPARNRGRRVRSGSFRGGPAGR